MTTPKLDNPFAVQKAQKNSVMAEATMAREVQEVQAAMIIAQRFPRDQAAATDRIIAACTRPSLAENALYSYARGGTEITGPSIRLAEAISQEWGHLTSGYRILETGPDLSMVEAFAYDLERNTRKSVTFPVPHTRHTKKGSMRLEDPRDIYEAVANQASRRVRACILAIIPGDVIDVAVRQCDATMSSNVQLTQDSVAKMVKAFEEFGVTRAMIEKRIQRRVDSITPGLMVGLRKIYASLKDGMGTVGDFFEVIEGSTAAPASPAATGVDKLKDKLKKGKTAPAATNIDLDAGTGGPGSVTEQTDTPDCSGEPTDEELDALERDAIENESPQ
jgi:hypothetical protein